jgi:minor extracellular serine protease Vpr
MKKLIAALVAAAALAAASPLQAGQTDLLLRQIVREVERSPASPWSKAAVQTGGATLIPCLVSTGALDATRTAIEKAGGIVTASIGGAGTPPRTILTVLLPAEAVAEIAAREEVSAVEASSPLSAKMDSARAATSVDVVQSGTALGVPYAGRNVVVGLVDDGLDYGHPDFARTGGGTRVQYLRQGTGTTLVECTHSAIAAGSCSIADRGQGTNHGTHVAGIAASADATYTGVAPEGDIMFVFNSAQDAQTSGTDPSSLATAVLEGVSAIFAKADLMDKPAVVNLSLGTSIGAHDGTSLLEQGLTTLSAAKPGRIIVNAAGNEQVIAAAQPAARRDYVGGIHASVDVPAWQSRGYRIGIWDGRGAASAFTGGTLVDLWLTAGQKDGCSVATFAYAQGRDAQDFTFPGLASTDSATFATADVPFATDTVAPVTASGGSVTGSISVAAADALNGKPHAILLFAPSSLANATALSRQWFDVVVRSTGAGACSGHMWLYFDYVGYHDFLKGMAGAGHDVASGATTVGYALADGDSLFTATVPSTAVGVLSAGSFESEKPAGSGASLWMGDDGVTYNQSDITAPGGAGSTTNDLSTFSSLGPTADGRAKPDVVTPGEPIISTKARASFVSSALTVGGQHFKDAGTSMSSPHLAGIVALLLERNNTLGVDAVRAAIQTGARTAGLTAKTADPANSYGAGKVDAAAALGSVSPDTSAYHGTGDLDGGGGDGGCALLPEMTRDAGAVPLAAIALLLLALIVVRRRKHLILQQARAAGRGTRSPSR